MNSGAIKFSEKLWQTMRPDAAVDLMHWLNSNMEPGYQIIRSNGGYCYFVGESDTLFIKNCQNQQYDVYNLVISDSSFRTEAEVHCTLTI